MQLKDLQQYITETLSLQDILINLGYDQDQLYIYYGELGIGISILVNDKQHVILVCPRPSFLTPETFQAEWISATDTWNQSSQQERHELIESSEATRDAVGILATLSTQDILPPSLNNFPCPNCGGTLQVDKVMGSIVHSYPQCAGFQPLDNLEFINAAEFERKSN